MCNTGFTSLPYCMRIQCWTFPAPLKLSCSSTCWQISSKAGQRCWWYSCLCHKNWCLLCKQSQVKKKTHEKVANNHSSTKSFESHIQNSLVKVCNFPWKNRICLFWYEIIAPSIHWELVSIYSPFLSVLNFIYWGSWICPDFNTNVHRKRSISLVSRPRPECYLCKEDYMYIFHLFKNKIHIR